MHVGILSFRVISVVSVCFTFCRFSKTLSGAGGVAGCAALAAGEGLARTGITDSILALFVAGSCVSLPPMMTFISLVAATLVAFEVKWTPSPAQMLVPSTVASSCKGDSSGPKNSRMIMIFASEVRAPAVAASERLFSDPEISLKKSGSWRLDVCGVGTAGGRDVPWQRYR
jgi:hypothetical protein